MESQTIEVLVQGGQISVSLCTLFVLYKLTTNHFVHLNDTLNRIEIALTKLIDKIK
jgi:hypothetical protein